MKSLQLHKHSFNPPVTVFRIEAVLEAIKSTLPKAHQQIIDTMIRQDPAALTGQQIKCAIRLALPETNQQTINTIMVKVMVLNNE